jgi:hypothetical protein
MGVYVASWFASSGGIGGIARRGFSWSDFMLVFLCVYANARDTRTRFQELDGKIMR